MSDAELTDVNPNEPEPAREAPPASLWPIHVETPVAWSDMDAFGHVNNAIYIRWFEGARIAWFDACDVMAEMSVPGKVGIGPILASTSCRFLRPVTYPDVITTETRTTRLGRSSFTMAYRVRSQQLGTVVAEGDGVVVMVDYSTGRAVPIGTALRARMLAVDAS